LSKRKTNSTGKLFLISTLVVVLILVFIWFYSSPAPTNWMVQLRPDGKDPYDTHIIHELLKKVRDDQPFISIEDSLEIRLKDSTEAIDNYVFIGEDFFVDSLEIDAIKRFVQEGNRAFIFTQTRYNPLLTSITSKSDIDYYLGESEFDSEYLQSQFQLRTTDTNTVAYIGVTPQQNYTYSVYNDFKKRGWEWSYFADSLFAEERSFAEVLGHYTRPEDTGGEDAEYPEYICFKFGKGEIYFHCNPIRFANYYAKNDTLIPYMQAAFSHLGEGKVIWDEESRNYEYNNKFNEGPPPLPNEGPLEFILSEPSLQRAWYVLLAGLILYLAFGAKRKQRVIPVMENMENTSIEYAETISQLFMKQEDHTKLVHLKIELYKSFLRERLKLLVPVHITLWNDEFIKTISQRSGIPYEKVSSLIEQCKYYQSVSGIETEKMLDFHNKLEEFYFNCK